MSAAERVERTFMKKYLTMKELPPEERPYEKCLKSGPTVLTDAELIAVVFKTGYKGDRSVDLANRVLNTCPDGLLNLITYDIEELKKVNGIGDVKAIQLKCIGEIGRRISTLNRTEGAILLDSEMVAMHFMEKLRHEKKENAIIAMFDIKGMLIGEELISIGTSNQSLVSSAEVFRCALIKHAEYIILLHNHPSGNPSPSEADIKITETLSDAGKLLGIQLADHIIIGDNKYFSFYEEMNRDKKES